MTLFNVFHGILNSLGHSQLHHDNRESSPNICNHIIVSPLKQSYSQIGYAYIPFQCIHMTIQRNLCNMDTLGPTNSALIFQVSLCTKGLSYSGTTTKYVDYTGSSVHINRFCTSSSISLYKICWDHFPVVIHRQSFITILKHFHLNILCLDDSMVHNVGHYYMS